VPVVNLLQMTDGMLDWVGNTATPATYPQGTEIDDFTTAAIAESDRRCADPELRRQGRPGLSPGSVSPDAFLTAEIAEVPLVGGLSTHLPYVALVREERRGPRRQARHPWILPRSADSQVTVARTPKKGYAGRSARYGRWGTIPSLLLLANRAACLDR
jgi:hypothetical protein